MRSAARALFAVLCLLLPVAPAAAAESAAASQAAPCTGVEPGTALGSPASTPARAWIDVPSTADVGTMGFRLDSARGEAIMTPVDDAFRACLPTSICCTCPQCCIDSAAAPTGLVG